MRIVRFFNVSTLGLAKDIATPLWRVGVGRVLPVLAFEPAIDNELFALLDDLLCPTSVAGHLNDQCEEERHTGQNHSCPLDRPAVETDQRVGAILSCCHATDFLDRNFQMTFGQRPSSDD